MADVHLEWVKERVKCALEWARRRLQGGGQALLCSSRGTPHKHLSVLRAPSGRRGRCERGKRGNAEHLVYFGEAHE